MTEDDDWPVYGSVGDRLSELGLHPSHQWAYFTEGDCWDGIHAGIMCSWCEVDPLRTICYHELPRSGAAVKSMLDARGVNINPPALEPCPGGHDD